MPRAPWLRSSRSPKISLQINVNARQLGPGDFEVSLMLEGGAGEGAEALFKFEINYAGVFRVENVPQDQIQPLVMIEGPRLLFPFARQIIAESVRSGGYPPLYVDPVDFHGLYMQRLAAATASSNSRPRVAGNKVRGAIDCPAHGVSAAFRGGARETWMGKAASRALISPPSGRVRPRGRRGD